MELSSAALTLKQMFISRLTYTISVKTQTEIYTLIHKNPARIMLLKVIYSFFLITASHIYRLSTEIYLNSPKFFRTFIN